MPGDLDEALERHVDATGMFSHWWCDDAYYLYVRKGAEQDATTILNYLPEVIHDHLQLTQTVAKLLKIVALQDVFIQELSRKLEEAVRANIAVMAKNDTEKRLQELAEGGSDITDAKVEVKITANMKTQEKSKSKSQIRSKHGASESMAISAEIGTLASWLSGFKLAIASSSEELSDVRKLVQQSSSIAEHHEYQGDVVFSVKKITGNPRKKAEAAVLANRSKRPRE